ncbi:hypothetical protein Trco_004545 [Trichoderma cornu-damae]|uniref:Uncharacterized protein n=1 Tax=Trichoderma cornu-damae TaxID=654480 RepID=A0A9P8QTG4_9HYPO|nr:hypothetical protein Trco_004545 [Trichoderma cornu-damae]
MFLSFVTCICRVGQAVVRDDGVGEARVDGIRAGEAVALEGDSAQGGVGGQLYAEERCHGRLQGYAEEDFVEAHEALLRGRQAVVVGHGQHQAAGEGVTVDEGDGGHREAVVGVSETRLCRAERGLSAGEAVGVDGVLQVEAVAVELCDAAGGDEHAGRVAAELEQVEGREQGFAHGGGEAVIGGGE